VRVERPAELGQRAGPLVCQHRPCSRREFVEVRSVELAVVFAEYSLAQRGVVAGSPSQCVVGGDEVHRAAHEVGPHHASRDHQVVECGRVEGTQP
jgi:hypothetical protein